MNVVIWARVSSREQREGYSIDAQLRATRERAAKNGWTVVREFSVAESATRLPSRVASGLKVGVAPGVMRARVLPVGGREHGIIGSLPRASQSRPGPGPPRAPRARRSTPLPGKRPRADRP